MKKWMTILVVAMLVLSMTTAFADAIGVASRSSSTTDTTIVIGSTTITGDPTPAGFEIVTVPDTNMTVEIIDTLTEHVKEGNAVIDFFEPEVQNDILAVLNENVPATEALTLDDLRPWQIYEIVSVDAVNADDMEDVIVTFEFATPYTVGQKMVGILDTFNGERVEVEPNVFEFVSEKTALKAEVTEVVDGKAHVAVTFPAEAIQKMTDSVASTLSIFSEPIEG